MPETFPTGTPKTHNTMDRRDALRLMIGTASAVALGCVHGCNTGEDSGALLQQTPPKKDHLDTLKPGDTILGKEVTVSVRGKPVNIEMLDAFTWRVGDNTYQMEELLINSESVRFTDDIPGSEVDVKTIVEEVTIANENAGITVSTAFGNIHITNESFTDIIANLDCSVEPGTSHTVVAKACITTEPNKTGEALLTAAQLKCAYDALRGERTKPITIPEAVGLVFRTKDPEPALESIVRN